MRALMRAFWWIALAAALAPAMAAAQARSFRVEHYELRIEPDLASASLKARERIGVIGDGAGTSQLEFDAGALACRRDVRPRS